MSAPASRPLPDRLAADLRCLLESDNNAILTWADSQEEDPRRRWFEVHLRTDGYRFELTFRLWVPESVNQRFVAATLPAHLELPDFRPGRPLELPLGPRRLSELRADVPRTARTAARLLMELWRPLDPDNVALRELRPHPVQFETPYAELPAYEQ